MKTLLRFVYLGILFYFSSSNLYSQLLIQTFDSNWTSNPSIHSPAPTLDNWSSDVPENDTKAWHRNDYLTNWTNETLGSPINTGAMGTTYYARFHSRGISSGLNNNSRIISPTIDLSPYTNKDIFLSFYYINPVGTDYTNLLLSTDNGVTYTNYQTFTTTANWTKYTLKIPREFLVSTFKFSFIGVSFGNNNQNNADMGVDQVELYTTMSITSSNPNALCEGESTTLTADMPSLGAGTPTYSWSPATGLNTTIGPSVIATPTTTTTYTVTSTRNGFSHSKSITVGVKPLPQLTSTEFPTGANECNVQYNTLNINAPTTITPFTENFSSSPQWTVYGSLEFITGTISNSNIAGGTPPEGGFVWIGGANIYSEWLLYPNDGNVSNYRPISLLNYSSASLEFKHTFSAFGSYEKNIFVDVSTDLTNWNTVWETRNISTSIPATQVSNINLNNYVGSTIYIRFRYQGDSWGLNYWLFDDINILGTYPNFIYSPNTGLYLDATLTTPYTGTGSPHTLYAVPNGTENYLVTSTADGCVKTATHTLTHNSSYYFSNSGNWNTANSWRPEIIPTIDKCVHIPNGKNVSVNIPDAIGKKLFIQEDGHLTILSNSSLTIKEEINIQNSIVNDNLIVHSDGNLLQLDDVSNIGNIQVERFVQDMNNILYQTMDYVYWSSPVTGQAIHNGINSIFSPGTPLNRNYQYKESNDYFVPTPDFTFKKGKGYAIRAEDGYPDGYDKTYQFTGIPNNGQILSEETLKYTDANHGYNLIGNPYPSNMDFEQFYIDNENFIEPVAYFWTNNVPEVYQHGSSYNGASYAIYNLTGGTPATTSADEGDGYNITEVPNGIVKVGQGFIVKAKSAGLNQSLGFNNHQRLADNGIFFQRNTIDRFWLKLTSPQGIINTILIGFNENAVDEYDYGYDAPLLSLYSDAIYSIVDNERLAINGRKGPFELNDVIPLGINPFSQGSYFISLGAKEGIFEEQQIFLKDKALNILHNLSDSPYEFRTTPGQHNHRFEIVFRKRPILHSATQGLAHKTDLTILKKDKSIFIESSIEEIREVEIFDLFGQSLYKKGNIQGRTYSIPQSLFSHQILIVSVKTESGKIESKKLILE